jgi:hypothetical protein
VSVCHDDVIFSRPPTFQRRDGTTTGERVVVKLTHYSLFKLYHDLEFKKDDSGKITAAVSHQPNGVFTATRK